MMRDEKLARLRALADEDECGIYEEAFAILYDFYEVAGFRGELLDAELGAMSNEQLIEAYLNL